MGYYVLSIEKGGIEMIPVKKERNSSILHQFISLTALYLVAYVVHKIYAFISRRFFTFMAPILDKVDLSLDG